MESNTGAAAASALPLPPGEGRGEGNLRPPQPGQEGPLDPCYVQFFEQFNRGEFFEAHDTLEKLWLKDRGSPRGDYYKGLIQLAGAFVHVSKGRKEPALALFKLAESNLGRYPAQHLGLDLAAALARATVWRSTVENAAAAGPDLISSLAPSLALESRTPAEPAKHASAAQLKPVQRLFPFALRSRIVIVGRENLARSRGRLLFVLITTDLSEKSRQKMLSEFRAFPIIEGYTSADLEKILQCPRRQSNRVQEVFPG